MRINFDMDGTIANFYGVENWLDYLKAEDTKPYEIAKPLFNFSAFARLLNKAKRNGYEIAVISWTSKNGSAEYDKAVESAKREWLAKHLPLTPDYGIRSDEQLVGLQMLRVRARFRTRNINRNISGLKRGRIRLVGID